MVSPNKNLKAVVEHFGLANIELARALDFDPSLVSRYLSGHRQLKAASPQMDAIAEFILERSQRVKDMEWLKEQFNAAGLATDMPTVYRFKQNLIMWLATDGKMLRKNLGAPLPENIPGHERDASREQDNATATANNVVKIGYLQIVQELRPILEALPHGFTITVFLSNDQVATAVNEDIAALLLRMVGKSSISINK